MKTETKIGIVFSLILSMMVFLPAAARSGGVWTHVASSCAIDESSDTKYAVNGAELGYNSTSTGYIYARCNVVNPDGGASFWNALDVVYRDPDGTATSNQVYVVLYRVSNSTGGRSTIATFNSNGFAGSSTAQHRESLFTHTFNWVSYAYYVEIRLYRSATGSTNNPAAFIVRLVETIF